MVEQGVAGDDDTEIFQKARPRFPSESEGDVGEPAVKPLGSASVVRGGLTGQSFREDCPLAGGLVAEEPPHVQVNSNGDSLPGQVSQHPPRVTRMDPGGSPLAPTGQRATREEVLATRVMAFSVARPLVRFSSLGAGSTVRESGMSNSIMYSIFSAARLPHLFTES